MFATASAKIINSIFPVYRIHPPAPGLTTVQVVGSGFFIDARGTFVTVAHAFDDAPPGAVYQYRGRSPDHFQNPALQISEVARDEQNDIYIGRVDAQLTHGLNMCEQPVPIGTSVCAAGYPLPQLTIRPDGVLEVGNVRRYFQNAMVLDRTVFAVENNRLHDGFMMTEFSLFGMSGGPVVNVLGDVVGMQASVTHPRVSVGAGGRQISIENAVAVGSEHVCAMLQKAGLRKAA